MGVLGGHSAQGQRLPIQSAGGVAVAAGTSTRTATMSILFCHDLQYTTSGLPSRCPATASSSSSRAASGCHSGCSHREPVSSSGRPATTTSAPWARALALDSQTLATTPRRRSSSESGQPAEGAAAYSTCVSSWSMTAGWPPLALTRAHTMGGDRSKADPGVRPAASRAEASSGSSSRSSETGGRPRPLPPQPPADAGPPLREAGKGRWASA